MPLSQEELNDLSHKNFAPETIKKIRWATKMFCEWRLYRHSHGFEAIPCDLDDITSITEESVIHGVCRFITEVKKVDGTNFPGKTLHDIVVCLQFHLETLGMAFKLLNQDAFRDIRFTLDNVMKACTAQGIGISVRRAQILSTTDEDYLWSIGRLGTSNPDQLLTTLVFMIGKGFALRADKEHQNLRNSYYNSQLSFVKDEDGDLLIRYTEDIGLKTNKGGLKHRKVEAKSVDLFPIENANRCRSVRKLY